MKSNNLLKKKRLPLFMAVFLIVVLFLQACSGAATTSAPVEPTESSLQAQESTEEVDEAAMQESGVQQNEQVEEPSEPEMAAEGTLRVAMQPLVQTDPALISSDSEVLVANHIYDYLVDVDTQSNPIPRLATGWDVSEDGLVYTFTLAEGVTFHDGSPFTAQDVVWTFNRLRDPDAEYPTSDLYANIESIEATGDLEVIFTLNQPNPFFLYDLSDNHALVLKAETEDATQFNGTGPFVVTNYSPEDRIEMTANTNYWAEGQPKLAGHEIIFFADETAAVDALRSGQVDLAMRMSAALFESLQNEPGNHH